MWSKGFGFVDRMQKRVDSIGIYVDRTANFVDSVYVFVDRTRKCVIREFDIRSFVDRIQKRVDRT
jgi:hypothetical protein